MTKKTQRPRLIGTYDEQLKAAIMKLKNVPMAVRISLYQEINQICYTQVQDCVDGAQLASFNALHDRFGFGKKRLARLAESTQETMDDAARRYEIGAMSALRSRLESATGYHYMLQGEVDDEQRE